MDVPAGRVHTLETTVRHLPGQGSPASFDQRRHARLGSRPGSWMALALRLPFPATRDELARAWLAVVARHGTLRTVVTGTPGSDDDPLRLADVEVTGGRWHTPCPEPGGDPRPVLRRLLDRACDPFAAPSHRLCLVEPDDPARTPVVVVGLDHCHVDAWSLLVLMRDLVTCLDDVVKGREPGAAAAPAPAFAEHTRELAARPSPPVWVHERWSRVLDAGDGGMPVFPLDLGDVSEPRDEVVEVRDVLGPDALDRLEEAARAAGVRMIALAVSEMTRVVAERGGGPLRAVLPVHSRGGDGRWDDSVGWFITNSVLECASPDPADCARAVREAVALGAHALDPVLGPHGGMPHTPGMFAVSWLDNRRLPVDVDLSLRPQHVSASIRTTGVMVWFVVNATGLHVRCRYPDTGTARYTVGAWLDEVCRGLARRASPVAATAR